nr:hypothetical protein CJLB15_00076 [Campylobacter phage CJLB-15]
MIERLQIFESNPSNLSASIFPDPILNVIISSYKSALDR